jgi:hypothetical protein
MCCIKDLHAALGASTDYLARTEDADNRLSKRRLINLGSALLSAAEATSWVDKKAGNVGGTAQRSKD